MIERFFGYAILTGALFMFLLEPSSTALAQRGPGAKGGSITRERVKEEPRPTPAPLGITGAREEAEACPSPTPDPSPPEPFCDPEKGGTCPGTYVFTYAFNAKARPRHSAGTAETETAGFAFFVYATRRIFFEIDNDNVVSQKVQNADRVTGVGDTTLIGGGDLLLENESQPNVSVLYGIMLPSASQTKGLGSGEIDHLLLGSVSKSFGLDARNSLGLDTGVYFAGKGNDNGFYKIPIATGSFERVLDCSRKYIFHAEIGGSFRTEDIKAEIYNLNYLKINLSDRVQWRIGGRVGLTPNSPRVGFFTAIRFDGNLKEIF
jgi:hypothetical protein